MAGFALLLVGGLGYATTLRDRNDGGDAALQVEESIAPSTSQLPNDTQDSAVIDEEDNASETPSTTETSEQPTTTESSNVEPLGDGSLGTVVVPAGESIQIRSIEAISGDVAFLGLPNQRGTELAIEHYGPIEGFNVDLGVPLDDLCSADGGDAGARIVLSDSQVVGVIGTSCSGAAVSASPLISDGGLVMISPSNTSPALTSDLAGNAGTNNEPGYHRTAHNDLLQAQALAHFAFNVLGHTTAAAIHDGDPYTQSLADTFALTFTNLGGEITSTAVVDREGTDMASVLAGIGEAQPQAIFMPIFDPAGSAAVQQIPTTSGLENASILTTDALLYDAFLEQPISEGIWISGPDLSYGTNQNQATQRRANEVVAEYVAAYGEAPSAQFWAHSYDATTLLLEAISQASRVEGDTLVIDRAGVREYLSSVTGFSGLTGTLNCDEFGDCGAGKIDVFRHDTAGSSAATQTNVVYGFPE